MQVERSNRVARKRPAESNGTPAMDLGFENIRKRKYTDKRRIKKPHIHKHATCRNRCILWIEFSLFTSSMYWECHCFIYVGVSTSTRRYQDIACRAWDGGLSVIFWWFRGFIPDTAHPNLDKMTDNQKRVNEQSDLVDAIMGIIKLIHLQRM